MVAERCCPACVPRRRWPPTDTATSAVLGLPDAVAVDAAGDVFITDAQNNLVQEIPAISGTNYGIAMTAGDIYAIAGIPQQTGNSGDGGPGSSALLDNPAGLA